MEAVCPVSDKLLPKALIGLGVAGSLVALFRSVQGSRFFLGELVRQKLFAGSVLSLGTGLILLRHVQTVLPRALSRLVAVDDPVAFHEKTKRESAKHLLLVPPFNHQAIAERNRQLPAVFRSQRVEEAGYEPYYENRCERAHGCPITSLIQLPDGTHYPANRIDFDAYKAKEFRGGYKHIIAEAPIAGARDAFYQMALVTGASVIVTVLRPFTGQPGDWRPDPSYSFYPDGELRGSETAVGGEQWSWTVAEEVTIDLNATDPDWAESITAAASADKDNYEPRVDLRILEVQRGSTRWRLLHVIPYFVAASPPYDFQRHFIELVHAKIAEHGILLDESHPMIVHCRTGLDRSGQFIIQDDILRDLRTAPSRLSQPECSALANNFNMVQETIDRALILASQSKPSAGIHSINTVLLPQFLQISAKGHNVAFAAAWLDGARHAVMEPEQRLQLEKAINDWMKTQMIALWEQKQRS